MSRPEKAGFQSWRIWAPHSHRNFVDRDRGREGAKTIKARVSGYEELRKELKPSVLWRSLEAPAMRRGLFGFYLPSAGFRPCWNMVLRNAKDCAYLEGMRILP